MARRSERRRGVGLALLLATGATAQSPATVVDFRTGDGSRFVLLPQPGSPALHWAIATPAGPGIDPAGHAGLAGALVEVSLNGTWRTGTSDPARERQAARALDEALATAAAAVRSGTAPPELTDTIQVARARLLAAADPQAFRRVLAAAPAQDLEVVHQAHAAVLVLTTVPAALPTVADLLLERREQSALRGAVDAYLRRGALLRAQWEGDPLSPLRAEALALAYPGDPQVHLADLPATTLPDLATIEACWRQTQQPARSVHVLIGNFDAAQVRQELERAFAVTAMPVVAPPTPRPPRPLAGIRRSAVPGTPRPAAVLAWPIDRTTDREIASWAMQWLAFGPESVLGRGLAADPKAAPTVAGTTPWPPTTGPALFLVEATVAAGDARVLADRCLQLLRAAAATPPSPAELQRLLQQRLLLWEAIVRDGRAGSSRLAAMLVADPALTIAPPRAPDAAAVQTFVQRLLAQNPVLVEGRTP